MVQTRFAPNKVETHYEFGGPIGALGISFGLPFVCYLFLFACNDVTGCPPASFLHPTTLTLDKLAKDIAWPGVAGLINFKAATATVLYYALGFFFYAVLPATDVEGSVLRSGARLRYRFNAFNTALATLAIFAAGTLAKGSSFILWTFIWDNYVQLLTSNILISYALATYVYVRSFTVKSGGDDRQREIAEGGNTGNILYDWYIGRELNPPVHIPFVGNIDIKSYMELRPGMLAWVILDLAFIAKQHLTHGLVTDSILIVVLSQSVYVFDALWNEPAILTTMDITTDGFGFMLSFGDLVWVPFTYSLQARYLAIHPVKLGLLGCLGVFAVQGVGYYIFRAANNEKNRFRTDPTDPRVSHLEYIETKTGSKLLVTGWWGTARHINYLGDWLMSWSYCLPTAIAGYVIQPSSPFHFDIPARDGVLIKDDFSLRGGNEVIPGEAKGWGMLITYFFMVYFAILLIHRERRDDEKCRKKYGKDWEVYCKRVPWRIIPYVY